MTGRQRGAVAGPSTWSAPDADGEQVAPVGGGKRNSRGLRRWRRRITTPLLPDSWPAEWRTTLKRWLGAPASLRRCDSLLRKAGGDRVQMTRDLFAALLEHGWIEYCEVYRRGNWEPAAFVWRERAALHAALGLPPPDFAESVRATLQGCRFDDPVLDAAVASLRSKSSTIIQRRIALLRALDEWRREGREGTRREFAQQATGRTKSIRDADWLWLERLIDLEMAGVSRHSAALWLRAPLALHLPHGVLDLRAVPDLIGLSPATVARVGRIDGVVGCWRLVENRTSFERAARGCGDRDAVVWLPGHAPHWWTDCVVRLLRLAPAPARIACDPDPAGIEIAANAARSWEAAALPWTPWQMDAAALHGLRHRLPLTVDDRERLHRLARRALPESLRELATAIGALDAEGLPAKGEQEGLDLSRRD